MEGRKINCDQSTDAFWTFEGARFARAVWPQQAENFTALHIEADVVYGHKIAVGFAEIMDR
jgi:hypothetical protein